MVNNMDKLFNRMTPEQVKAYHEEGLDIDVNCNTQGTSIYKTMTGVLPTLGK